MHCPGVFSSVQTGLAWLATNADRQAIVAISMPHWAYLNMGLKTVMPPLESDPVKAQEMLDSVPVSYLVLEGMFMEGDFNSKFPLLVRNSPERWRLAYASSTQDVEIYQRIR